MYMKLLTLSSTGFGGGGAGGNNIHLSAGGTVSMST